MSTRECVERHWLQGGKLVLCANYRTEPGAAVDCADVPGIKFLVTAPATRQDYLANLAADANAPVAQADFYYFVEPCD